MGPKEDVVLVWAVMPKEDYNSVVLPKGCFAQAVNIGAADQLIQQRECKTWGGVVAGSIYAWVKKAWPELQESSLIMPGR